MHAVLRPSDRDVSGLLALGVIERSTRDVDLLALRSDDELDSAKPMPAELEAARNRVARDFSLLDGWLNPGPTDLLDLGLPEEFIDRLERRDYGQALTVYFASPTHEELVAAARWSRSHDPSEGYAQILGEVLAHMGVRDVDLGS
jgi:hypothetical protein